MREFIRYFNENSRPGIRRIDRNTIDHREGREFFIEDSHDRSVFWEGDSVENPRYAEFNCFKVRSEIDMTCSLWPIDGQYVRRGNRLSETFPKKCDCAFGTENYLGLVEFKTNSFSENPISIKDNQEKAYNQLKDMVNYLKYCMQIPNENYFSILEYKVEAFICAPPHYPRKSATMDQLSIRFLEEVGIELFQRNHKDFE
jgi:hypothetical protein